MKGLLNKISKCLVLFSYENLNTYELNELQNTLKKFTPTDWLEFDKLIRLNCIEPQAFRLCEKYNFNIPENIKFELSESYKKTLAKNQIRIDSISPLLKSFIENKIEFVILKGNALLGSIYQSIGYKKMNDVDILVQKKELDKISILFAEYKLLSAAALSNDNYRAQEKYSHHWPPFFDKNLDFVVGLHWNLISPLTSIEVPIEKMWQRKVPINFYGMNTYKLETTDFLFHLLVHFSLCKTGLKEFMDIFNLIREENDKIDLSYLKELIKTTKAFDRIYHSVQLSNALMPNALFDELVEFCEPQASYKFKKYTVRKIVDPNLILASRSTHISKIEKTYSLFSLSRNPFEKSYLLSKMWKHFLFPKKSEIQKIMYLKEGDVSLSSRILVIKEISYLLASELGWKVFILISLRHHLDVFNSYVDMLVLKKVPTLKNIFLTTKIDPSILQKMEVSLE